MSQTAVAEKPAEPEIMPDPIRPLLANRLILSPHQFGEYEVVIPAGTPLEHLFREEFWVNVAPELKANEVNGRKGHQVGAKLLVHTEDHSFYVKLYVTAVRENGLTVKIMKPDKNGICWLVDPAVLASEGSAGYKIRYNVGARGYDVIRESDNKIVSHAKDNPTKEDALNWIAEAKKAA